MVSCGTTNVNSISKPSEAWLVRCEAINKDGQYQDFGQVWNKLNEVTDMYLECAARHNALVEFEQKRK